MIVALALAAALGVTDLDGRPTDPFRASAKMSAARAVVFVFLRPDCPVSNRYVPELNRLRTESRRRRVVIWIVYAGVESLQTARAHYAEYGLSVPALVDRQLVLAGNAGVTVTPEAIVYEPRGAAPAVKWTLVYRGRIDDRAPSLGVWRPVAAVRDLADVMQRIAAGEVVAYRVTQAVGCQLRP